MGYINSFKMFFNKENVDFSEGEINPYDFHKTFYFLAKLFCILDKENTPKWMMLTPIIVSILGSMAAFICFTGFVHSLYLFNVPLATETSAYLVVMVYKIMIVSTTWRNLSSYRKLTEAIKTDFQYICTIGNKYRERFFNNHLITFKICILAAIFLASIAFGMIICTNLAVVWFIITHDENNDENKPLPFPFWLFDVNFNASPTFEISLVCSILFIVSQLLTYVFMVQTQIVWVRQITSKADVIIWNIQDLLIDVQPTKNPTKKGYHALFIKHRMKNIVRMHQEMYRLLHDYAAVFKKLLIYEQTLAGPLICMTAYCIAEQLDSGEISGILMLLCVSIIVSTFLPSYLCTFLLEKCQAVRYACWEIPFWNAGKVIRPYLIVIMQRSMRPLPINAAGFKDITLETYANTISNAYKCFNMLRRANFDN